MKTIVSAFLVLFAYDAHAWTLPDTYSAGPTWGTVVDGDTQQPIKGALVIALWDLEGGVERSRFDTFRIAETLTNERGEFRMEGWVPVPRPAKGLLDKYDPMIIVFKSGYMPVSLLNDKLAAPYARVELEVRDSAYNGSVTALKKYQGAPKNYVLDVATVVNQLSFVLFAGSNCRWKQIPKTLRILEEEKRRDKEQGLVSMIGVSVNLLLQQEQCEPTDQFLKAYQGSD